MPSTERLLLRRWQPADRDPFAAVNADPEVMRYIGDGRAMTRAQSDELVDAIDTHWERHGYGLWCAELAVDPGTCIGFVGLAIPAFLPAVLPAVEVGWRLARPVWGRGLATEGAQAALDHAFGPLELRSVVSLIDPGNERSIRVAHKLGMRREASHLHPATRRKVDVYAISSEDAASSLEPA